MSKFRQWKLVRDRNDHWGMVEVVGPRLFINGFKVATNVTPEMALQTELDALLIAAAPAFAQAWRLVPGEIKRQIFDRLNKPESKWVEESINAFERGNP